jgi:hypothetical protein
MDVMDDSAVATLGDRDSHLAGHPVTRLVTRGWRARFLCGAGVRGTVSGAGPHLTFTNRGSALGPVVDASRAAADQEVDGFNHHGPKHQWWQ